MTGHRNRPPSAAGADGAPIRSCLGRWLIVVAAWGALRLATVPALSMAAPWRPGALVSRLESDAPFVAAVALAHLAVTWVGLYVVVLVSVGVVVRIGGLLWPRPARAAPAALRCLVRLSLPGTRTLLAWSIGFASLGGSLLTVSPAFAAGGSAPPNMMATSVRGSAAGRAAPPVMSLIPVTSPNPPTRPPRGSTAAETGSATPRAAPQTTGGASGPGPDATQGRETTSGAPATAAPVVAPSAPEGVAPPPADVAPTAASSGRWVVQPGDHLWSISERTLAAAWGAPPALDQLGPYWWRVVTANRPTLPDPGDIDLLFPGDVVTLPPLLGDGPV